MSAVSCTPCAPFLGNMNTSGKNALPFLSGTYRFLRQGRNTEIKIFANWLYDVSKIKKIIKLLTMMKDGYIMINKEYFRDG